MLPNEEADLSQVKAVGLYSWKEKLAGEGPEARENKALLRNLKLYNLIGAQKTGVGGEGDQGE